MDSAFCNSLLTGVNAAEAPVFVWGFPGVSTAGYAGRMTRRAALNPDDVERTLVLLCAELTGLRMDSEIYRRDWPPRQESAYLFRLEREHNDPSQDYRRFSGTFSGRNPDRDAALAVISTLRGKLPPVWVTISSRRTLSPVTLAKVEVSGDSEFLQSEGDGKTLFVVRAELSALVCTTPPRGSVSV